MFYKPKHAKKNPNPVIECTKRAVERGVEALEKYKSASIMAIDKFDETIDRFGAPSTSEE